MTEAIFSSVPRTAFTAGVRMRDWKPSALPSAGPFGSHAHFLLLQLCKHLLSGGGRLRQLLLRSRVGGILLFLRSLPLQRQRDKYKDCPGGSLCPRCSGQQQRFYIQQADGEGQLFRTSLEGQETRTEALAEDIYDYKISDDGRTIYYLRSDNKGYTVRLFRQEEGKEEEIAQDVSGSYYITPDGRSCLYLVDVGAESGCGDALPLSRGEEPRLLIADLYDMEGEQFDQGPSSGPITGKRKRSRAGRPMTSIITTAARSADRRGGLRR